MDDQRYKKGEKRAPASLSLAERNFDDAPASLHLIFQKPFRTIYVEFFLYIFNFLKDFMKTKQSFQNRGISGDIFY